MKKRYIVAGLFGFFLFINAINEDETKEMESTKVVEEVESSETEVVIKEVEEESEPVDVVEEDTDTEESSALPIDEVLTILEDSFGDSAEISYEEESNIISINSTDQAVKDELLAMLMGDLSLDSWNVMVDSFVFMSDQLGEPYTVAFLNPHNTDNVLLMVSDGIVLYDAFNE